MRLNPEKCAISVEGGKFLGFMITHGGIEANPNKFQAIAKMRSPQNVEEVQQLIGRLTALSRFLSQLVEQTWSMVQLLHKAAIFNWTRNVKKYFNKWRNSCPHRQLFKYGESINRSWCTYRSPKK